MKTDTDFYPYAPSLLKWNKTKSDFTDPATCDKCHPGKYEEWQGDIPTANLLKSTSGSKTSGPVTIHARLQFRQASQAIAEKLYKLFPDPALAEKTYGVKQLPMIPVVELTSTTVVLKDRI